mgnify:FL=1
MKLGTYKHYKNKFYTVLGMARHTETLEELVVYQAQYDDPEFGPKAIWVRPKKMFEESVEWEGKTVPRFEFIE